MAKAKITSPWKVEQKQEDVEVRFVSQAVSSHYRVIVGNPMVV